VVYGVMIMWGSALVGDDYDDPMDIGDIESPSMRAIIKELAQHPRFKDKPKGLVAVVINLQTQKPQKKEEKEEKEVKKSYYPKFADSGEGWFEERLGKSADSIVKDLRRARRHYKDFKSDIDDIIFNVQTMKAAEVEATLQMYDWMDGRSDTIRSLGLSDRDLKSLRRFGNARSNSLIDACNQWDNATGVIKTLESVEDVWDNSQKQEWAYAMQMRKDARKAWRSSLHQMDSLTKDEKMWLQSITGELEERGPMTTRVMVDNLLSKGLNRNQIKSISPQRLGKLLKMYGDELNIMKGGRRGEYILVKENALVIKGEQMWPYAAGFLDADGYLSITKRGEPRAGFIATGARGRIHCEQLHKTLGCGVLQLDQKVYKDGQRSQHRLQFYSKDDLRKLLHGIMPHLQMKKTQARAMIEYLDADTERKAELQRVVQYENWRDTRKGQELLHEWGVDAETVGAWREAIV